MAHPVTRCKLVLHSISPREEGANVSFGAVWEAGTDEEKAQRENAIFGKYTPMAEFKAYIANQSVIDELVQGAEYYVDFTKADK